MHVQAPINIPAPEQMKPAAVVQLAEENIQLALAMANMNGKVTMAVVLVLVLLSIINIHVPERGIPEVKVLLVTASITAAVVEADIFGRKAPFSYIIMMELVMHIMFA